MGPVKDRGKMYRRYCGFIGAVTDFEMHPTQKWIASVGLGRTLVMHHMKVPRLPMWRKYLKQKLTSVLYCSLKCHEWIRYEPKPEKTKKEKSKAERDAFFEKWRLKKKLKKERLKEQKRIKEERKDEPGFDSDGDPIEG